MHRFLPEHSRREDETPDERFYAAPRLVVHIDDGAVGALRQYFSEVLPPQAALLDLMSSWRSHLPEDMQFPRIAGLGMNAVELSENPQLTERVVHDLNLDSSIPFDDDAFDAVLLTVSVQYLVHPIAVFAEVARVLRPGGQFIVSFSNRMFPTKAVHIWRAGNDSQHLLLVADYFRQANGFSDPVSEDRTPKETAGDPLYVVRAAAKPHRGLGS